MPRPRCCSPPRPVPLFWLQPALLPDALQLRLAALEAAVTDPQVRCSLLLTSCPLGAEPLLDPLLPSPARRPSGYVLTDDCGLATGDYGLVTIDY